MANGNAIRYRIPLLIVGALFVIWGILGLIDQRNVPYTGYLTDGNNTVIRVDPGSPAERAGLKKGDFVRSNGGISVEDSRALARRERPTIGQTRTLVVERRGETVPGAAGAAPATESLDITYTNLPGRDAALGYAAFLIGLCFVGCGLSAYLKVPSRSTTLLGLMGLCIGLAFFAGPYFSSFFVRTLVSSIQSVIVMLSLAFLLHFMLEFPRQKAFLQKKHATKIIYGPAVLIALFVLFLIIVEPRATSGLNQISNILFGLFFVAYFGCAVVVMIHTYAKATPQERSEHGLNIVLAGILIGLLPVTIASLISIFAPRLVLPGLDFYFLTMILIPITLAMAVLRQKPAPTVARS
jgi:hypothetical protein